MTENKTITNLYEHYKNTPKKLKIVCDWDEVIQTCESYALWLAKREIRTKPTLIYPAPPNSFSEYFNSFWGNNTVINNPSKIKYSPYGSSLSQWFITMAKSDYSEDVIKRQIRIKNDDNFYQQAPFLTIAEDLLKLIKEDKVESLIFLSAYDKKKFPNGDDRKVRIFAETFNQFLKTTYQTKIRDDKARTGVLASQELNISIGKELAQLILIPFDNENQGQSKADWIKQNASDYDIFIDDNPNICRSVVKSSLVKTCPDCCKKKPCSILHGKSGIEQKIIVLAPYYTAVASQHDERVLLVKNEVSDLKKEDFK